MPAQEIVPGLHAIPLGFVNAFFLDDPAGGVLIDTGAPRSAVKILSALKGLGKQPSDIHHILLTHAHADHIGSAAALVKATGARTYMHALDAPITERGSGPRPLRPAPGLLTHAVITMVSSLMKRMTWEPCKVDRHIEDGESLPLAGGLTAIHVPGHCLGQLAFHWPRHGGVLFAADSCGNLRTLNYSIAYEDIEEGKRSLRKLAELDFQIAVFGHGKPIPADAGSRFRQRWAGV